MAFTGQYLPHHVGIPIGGRQGPKYYMLEIHYDNPKAKRGNFIQSSNQFFFWFGL